MKKILAFAVAFALFAATQAFAIIGAGAHYVYNMGATLKGDREVVGTIGGSDITLNRGEATDLQGLGFKAWIDFLPFVDIEATFNVAATRYSPCLEFPSVPGTAIPPVCLEYTPEAPFGMVFGKASPIYGVASGDISITYPIDLPIIRPYAGAGVSYMLGMPLVDKKFAESLNLDYTSLIDPLNQEETQKKISDAFSEALKNSDYTSGIGAHIIVGVRAKLPIIPIAAYANTKYYLGGSLNSKFSQGVVFELGGGLAI